MATLLLTTNRTQGNVRRESLGGRDYLVAPVVAIRAGILNNELATVEEIGHFVDAWNGIPVPLGHPKENGLPISANSPQLDAQVVVGRFWNAELVDDRLRGEIWVDLAKVSSLTGDALKDALEAVNRLETNQGIEVSTAYFRDLEETPGTLNGQRYLGIQRNMRPDHLALLLHEVGACSWKDGCGVPRVNQLTANQAVHNGVIVALYPSTEAAASLVVSTEQLPEGAIPTPAAEIHMTLAYLGNLNEGDVQIEQGRLLEMVMNIAKQTPIVRGMVSGIGRFSTTDRDGNQALFALYDCDYLHGLHYWVSDWAEVGRSGRGFIPHITLAYLPAAAVMPNVLPEPRELVFDRIGVAWGGQVTMFGLQGEAAEVAANNTGNNPFALAKKALRGLAGVFGIKTADALIENAAPGAENTSGPQINVEEVSMGKKELVEKLAANQRCPFEKGELEAMAEGSLVKLDKALEGGCGGSTPATNAQQPAEMPAEMVALRDELKGLLGKLEGVASGIQANQDQQKGALVNELKANEACAFDESDLQAMSLAQLEKLSASLRPVDFSGRGGPRGNARNEEQVPEMPAVVMAKVESGK